MGKWDFNQIELDFLENDFLEDEKVIPAKLSPYKVLIADDDHEVHRISKLMLRGFEFEGKNIETFHAYSGEETLKICKNNPDIAVLFLDVVMESEHSGLHVVKMIREVLGNNMTRIIIRTGQPGQAPEYDVVRRYDINDYHLKTEVTMHRLHITLYTALRNYRDLISIEKHRSGLQQVIEASSRLFRHNTLDDFLKNILDEFIIFQNKSPDLLGGFVTMEQEAGHKIIAAIGKYSEFIERPIEQLPNFEEINIAINKKNNDGQVINYLENAFIIKNLGKSKLNNFIFIEGTSENFNFDLIKIFLSNFSIALDNYIINNMVQTTQQEIIYALGETIESHFEETGSHVKRVTRMMHQFAIFNNFSYSEAEMLEVASSMHDLGKIAIPENILKKPGKLTKEEFNIIKTHTEQGYKILNNSDLPALCLAAEIAYSHHEKYDGTGYPEGLSRLDIPVSARMMAIVDVFDALTHKRVYKDAMSIIDAAEYIKSQKGKHFDPKLVDIFINNLEDILEKI